MCIHNSIIYSSKQQAPADTDDEEIPSDSDEEMVGKRHTTDSKPEVKVGKRKFKTEDYPGFLVKRHREFQDYRYGVLEIFDCVLKKSLSCQYYVGVPQKS